MNKGRILSLGSVNVDFQARAEDTPRKGETTLVSDLLLAGGGKAANVAFLARRLGVEASLVARTGDDVLAATALDPLRRIGVDLSLTRAAPGEHTGAALILVGPDADKSIALAPNANLAWSARDIEEAVGAVADAPEGSVLVCDMEISPDAVAEAAAAAKASHIPVVLDPSPADRVSPDLLEGLDYITPNPREAETLTGIPVRSREDAFRAGEALRGQGVRHALIKLKDGGCAVTGEEGRFLVEPLPVDPVDKTGAGDAFAGALAVGVLWRLHLREAVRMAVDASSIAVTRYGSQDAYPDHRELVEWMERLAPSR
jgi:ribokinase